MSAKATFFQLPRTTQFAFWLGICFIGLVIYDQVYYWSTFEDYSFGYLVPIFVAYVVYDRWPKIQSILYGTNEGHGDAPITPLMRVTAFLFYIGLLVSFLFFLVGGVVLASQGPSNQGSMLMAAGLGGVVIGLAFLVAKEDTKGRQLSWKERLTFTFLFLFPALAWLVSAPMVMYLDSTIRVILLEKVTIVVYEVFTFLGLTMIREGNILQLPKGEVGVADACSGVRSLTGCIFVGSFMAAVFLDRFWKKVLMIFLSICLAIITNLFRSLFLTGWAYAYGSGAIDGDIFQNLKTLPDGTDNPEFVFATVHDIAGYSVMGLTFIFLLMLLPIFNFKIAPPDEEEYEDEEVEGDIAVSQTGEAVIEEGKGILFFPYRLKRWPYLFIAAICNFIGIIIGLSMQTSLQQGNFPVSEMIIGFGILVIMLMFTASRCRDVGYSLKSLWLLLIPFVGVIYSTFLSFAKSKEDRLAEFKSNS